jgi:hypothetical protein
MRAMMRAMMRAIPPDLAEGDVLTFVSCCETFSPANDGFICTFSLRIRSANTRPRQSASLSGLPMAEPPTRSLRELE